MNEKKSYKVQIFEEQYVLISDGSEGFILRASEMVDNVMKEVSQQSTITDVKKIAVLSALRIAEKLLNYENNRQQEQQKFIAIEDYINQELSNLNL